MLHVIWVIVIGFIIGVIAKFLTPGRDAEGFFITAAIGIAGSFIATYIGQELGWYAAGHNAGFIGSVIGAVALLGVYHIVRKSS